jgi:hypothetical protein
MSQEHPSMPPFFSELMGGGQPAPKQRFRFFRVIAWWLFTPVRLVLTLFLCIVLTCIFADHENQLREMLRELWTRP